MPTEFVRMRSVYVFKLPSGRQIEVYEEQLSRFLAGLSGDIKPLKGKGPDSGEGIRACEGGLSWFD